MLICPHCAMPLIRRNDVFCCNNGHSFDIASSGYCNLLTGSKPGEFVGDNKEMVSARRRFLDSGAYENLQNEVCVRVLKLAENNLTENNSIRIIDAGCGEGYYTRAVASSLSRCGLKFQMVGVDISKAATQYAAKRDKLTQYITASSYHLPIASSSADIVLSLFAPTPSDEFLRVLKQDGKVLIVAPGAEHLWELKKAIYDEPYKNQEDKHVLPGFTLIHRQKLSYKVTIADPENIQALFSMTPYIHRTGKEGMERLCSLKEIDLTLSFVLMCFNK